MAFQQLDSILGEKNESDTAAAMLLEADHCYPGKSAAGCWNAACLLHQLSDCGAGHAECAACQLSEKPRGSFLLPSLHHLLHHPRQLEEGWCFCQLISWSSNLFQVAVLEF